MKLPETLSAARRQLIEEAAAELKSQYGDGFLGMVLSGSAGRGMETDRSDLDVLVVVTPELVNRPLRRDRELELLPVTLEHLERLAAFGDDQWGYRWTYAWAPTLLDHTGGRIEQAIERQTHLSADETESVLAHQLDAWINLSYRALKCARDGHALAARLYSAEAVGPLLDVVFALGGLVRPYSKYLEWALQNHPLPGWPDLIQVLERYLDGDAATIRASVQRVQASELAVVREVFDGWAPAQYGVLRGEEG